MDTFFSVNLKFLRKRRKFSQEDLAGSVGLKRHDIDNYERGVVPSPENMIIISDCFKMTVDSMLRTDISKLSEFNIRQLEFGHDSYIKGTKIRIHTTTVDSKNRENVELVMHKAKAGYLTGYKDPEYLSCLPTFHLPFLTRNRKYRMFQLDGDSMAPIPDKSFVLAEFVENWFEVKDGTTCVLLTLNDGITYKKIENQLKKERQFILHPLNGEFKPYAVAANDVIEVWKFYSYMSFEVPQPKLSNDLLLEKVEELKSLIETEKE